MQPRERFIHALERRTPLPGERVPHFELVFYLTMEAFGRVHPSHRSYRQWDQMEEKERELHRRDMAEIFVATADRYEHDAIFIHPNPGSVEETMLLIEKIREQSDDRYFIMRHGDATFSIPDGERMADFSYRLVDEPAKVKAEAQQMVDDALERAERYRKHADRRGLGLDGFALCADYCLNTGPFLSPRRFAEFVTPYLAKLTQGYRDLGFYVIKHTDGNIMPILDQLVQTHPHALHSLDPQGGVDIVEEDHHFTINTLPSHIGHYCCYPRTCDSVLDRNILSDSAPHMRWRRSFARNLFAPGCCLRNSPQMTLALACLPSRFPMSLWSPGLPAVQREP
jgi:uroporphyrinogen decarboxylase